VPDNAVDVPNSPVWWLKQLSERLNTKLRGVVERPGVRGKIGLNELSKWLEGDPPLPEGAPEWKAAYAAFHRTTRTNYADLVTESARERMTPTGFRTGAANDDNGDQVAEAVWAASEMGVESVDLLHWMLGLGDSYAMVGPPEDGEKYPIITAEDPRAVITADDPVRRGKVRAGMKIYQDPYEGLDVAWIYVPAGAPGHDPNRALAYRATRPSGNLVWPVSRITATQWTWDDPIAVRSKRVPLVHFQNRFGVAEYERHIDILARLNHTTLQRMLIAELQAFRQRAIEGLPEVYPLDYPVAEMRGRPIDYEGIFTPGPGALWQLPPGAKFWESQITDIRPLLDAEDRDTRKLSAVTHMPVAYFNPDTANSSAEGASFQREGLIYRIEDRQAIAQARLAQTMSLAFEIMGDTARADVAQIETIWAPIERLSLTERYSAASQAKAAGLSNRTIRREVLGWSPRQLRAAESDDNAAIFEASLLAVQQAPLQAQPNNNPTTGQTLPVAQRQPSVAAA
jgi:hypothetical protein